MNASGLINMVMRLVMRKFLSRGIDAGLDRFAGKGTRGDKAAPPEAARRSGKEGRETARRAKQAMRLTRRIGRF